MKEQPKSELELEEEQKEFLKKMNEGGLPKKPSGPKELLEGNGLKVRFRENDVNPKK